MKEVNIIGAGLAGSECAWILANNGIKVNLYEMKPNKFSPAHKSPNFAELVCSNSLKSSELTNACGLLKYEMEQMGSVIVSSALESRVDAGAALAVNRDEFSRCVTEKIQNHKNINIIKEEVTSLNNLSGIIVIATGPLTSPTLSFEISKLVGDKKLYFYDAAAPIIMADSINMDIAYFKNRWKDDEEGDYLNLPMTREEYTAFYNALIASRIATRHDFDTIEAMQDDITHFEGCMPIESMAARGEKTLLFGPLKPVGLKKKDGVMPYAVVQLRAENAEKTMYNLVGFQTSLAFPEQKRVFSMIPGLENAEFVRYGVMHKNTYINSPLLLNDTFAMKENPNIYFAGQISGVEGYIESAASGMVVAYSIIYGKNIFSEYTMLGALSKYISSPNTNFQPMNANFGIVPPLNEVIRDKKLKYEKYAKRSIDCIKELKYDLEHS